jgi:glutathione S-transferase
MLTQSLAIVEYMIETRGVALLPDDAAERARVRALAMSSPWTFIRFAIFRWSRM